MLVYGRVVVEAGCGCWGFGMYCALSGSIGQGRPRPLKLKVGLTNLAMAMTTMTWHPIFERRHLYPSRQCHTLELSSEKNECPNSEVANREFDFQPFFVYTKRVLKVK